MSGREEILGKIRTALNARAGDGKRQAAVEARIAAPLRHPTPDRVRGKGRAELIALFRGFLEGQSATVVEVARARIPEAVCDFLRQSNLPQRLRVGADPFLAGLAWDTVPGLERASGRAVLSDEVGLSHALAGVAETGTMVLASGSDNPVTINFVPETHIVVVEAKTIVGSYEDAWEIIRQRFGEQSMPRTVNMISGPSRTGDIGGKLVMGAHGPRQMCVIIATE